MVMLLDKDEERVTPQTVPSRLPSLESWFRLNVLYVAAET
jgi:hypothetical protein